MFIVSTIELFDFDKVINRYQCNHITTLYFIVSLIYLIVLASWTVNLFKFYKVSSSLRLHTLITYFICLKTIVTVVKYNEFVNLCTTTESQYGIYNSLWMLFEFILSIITCLYLILISKGWGIVHVYLNPNDMKSATYLSICISFFAIILSDRNAYTLIFIMLMYIFIMNILINSSRPIIGSLKYYLNLLKTSIPMGDFTYHHNNLKLKLLNKIIICGCFMLIFSMIMYLLSYILGKYYFIWLALDETFDLITIMPMIYSLRLRVIKKFGIQPLNDIEREVTEDTTLNDANGNEYEMCVNNQPELQKFYLIVTVDKNLKHSQGTTLLAEVIEN